MRLIDADALAKFANNQIGGITANHIMRFPTVDAQPVKHGRWTWDSNAPHREHGAYKCSNCDSYSDFEENYCYKCGYKMDGGADDD